MVKVHFVVEKEHQATKKQYLKLAKSVMLFMVFIFIFLLTYIESNKYKNSSNLFSPLCQKQTTKWLFMEIRKFLTHAASKNFFFVIIIIIF